jgi:hypothetical protein
MDVNGNNHLLAPQGWRVTRCNKPLIPEPGTTILIGRSKNGKACSVAWVDKSMALRTIDNLVDKGGYWEALVKNGSQYYVVTVWEEGEHKIAGDVEPGRRSTRAGKKGGWEHDMSSTWGAEANPGGGGRT